MTAYRPGNEFKQRSRKFGLQKHPITGKMTGHKGDDWPAPKGTPIPAAYDGEVKAVAFQYNRQRGTGWGWYVVLEHSIGGKSVQTLYAHMCERSHLVVGSAVKQGASVGRVGNTGGSTGPHLHFEVRVEGRHVAPDSFDFPQVDAGVNPAEWAYPFDVKNAKEPPKSANYLGEYNGAPGAMVRAEDGFYPIGSNGVWHGGIHFDAGTGTVLDQAAGIRCIKGGEVIAYRVDKTYREVKFPNGRRAAYSTGFTLVRHALDRPTSDGATSEGGGRERLTFYSLYMHLLDWTGYSSASTLARPAYWAEPKVYRVGAKAGDRQKQGEVEPPSSGFETGVAGAGLGMCDGDADDEEHDHSLCAIESSELEGSYP